MIGSFFFCFHNPAELFRYRGTFPDQNCDQNYSKKPCTRREIMNFLIDKIDLFCSKIRIFRTWTFSRADGIQEVSGSIPLISTKGQQPTDQAAVVFFSLPVDLPKRFAKAGVPPDRSARPRLSLSKRHPGPGFCLQNRAQAPYPALYSPAGRRTGFVSACSGLFRLCADGRSPFG